MKLWYLAIVAAVVLVAVFFPHTLLWALGLYPTPTGTPWTYQLWSGFMPALAVIAAVWPFVNCHVDGCPRYGKYHAGDFRVCRAHHPDEDVRENGVTHRHIISKHKE
jgi:hypothetical protein